MGTGEPGKTPPPAIAPRSTSGFGSHDLFAAVEMEGGIVGAARNVYDDPLEISRVALFPVPLVQAEDDGGVFVALVAQGFAEKLLDPGAVPLFEIAGEELLKGFLGFAEVAAHRQVEQLEALIFGMAADVEGVQFLFQFFKENLDHGPLGKTVWHLGRPGIDYQNCPVLDW